MRNFNNEIRVTVSKTQLVEKLISNRDQHRTNFEKALDGWRKESILLLTDLADKIKHGRTPRQINVLSQPPADMTKEYNKVLEMLKMHTGTEMELDNQQFQALVMDDWDWSESWKVSNAKYTTQF